MLMTGQQMKLGKNKNVSGILTILEYFYVCLNKYKTIKFYLIKLATDF